MKKQGKTSRATVVWVMMIILAYAHLSFAAQENGTTTAYFGLIENDFDSEFPDAISSHFRRVLKQVQTVTTKATSNANTPAVNAPNSAYRGASPLSNNGGRGCASQYNRELAREEQREMKIKQGKASRTVVMWVMAMILLHAHVSIAAQEKKNGTDYFRLIGNDFDSDDEFPDAISSHIHRRVLAQVATKTQGTFDANNPAFNAPNKRYAADYNGPSPPNPGGSSDCRSEYYRACN